MQKLKFAFSSALQGVFLVKDLWTPPAPPLPLEVKNVKI